MLGAARTFVNKPTKIEEGLDERTDRNGVTILDKGRGRAYHKRQFVSGHVYPLSWCASTSLTYDECTAIDVIDL